MPSAARAYEAAHPGVIVNVRTQGIECAPGQWVYIDTSGKFPELTCVDYSPPAGQK
jgi:hypothetical protein